MLIYIFPKSYMQACTLYKLILHCTVTSENSKRFLVSRIGYMEGPNTNNLHIIFRKNLLNNIAALIIAGKQQTV